MAGRPRYNDDYFVLKRQLDQETRVKLNRLAEIEPNSPMYVMDWWSLDDAIMAFGCDRNSNVAKMRVDVEPGLYATSSDCEVLCTVCDLLGYRVQVFPEFVYRANDFAVYDLLADPGLGDRQSCLVKIITPTFGEAMAMFRRFSKDSKAYKYVLVPFYWSEVNLVMFERLIKCHAPNTKVDYTLPKMIERWFDRELNCYLMDEPKIAIITFDIETVSTDANRVPTGEHEDDELFTVSIHHLHTQKLYTLIYLPIEMPSRDMHARIMADGYPRDYHEVASNRVTENILECFRDERSLLIRTLQLLQADLDGERLHYLIGYNSLGYDIKYLFLRAQFYGLPQFERFVYRDGYAYGLAQMHVDLFRVTMMKYKMKNFKLSTVATALLHETKVGVDAVQLRFTFQAIRESGRYLAPSEYAPWPCVRDILHYNNYDTILVSKLIERCEPVRFVTSQAHDCKISLFSLMTNYNKMQYKLWSKCFVCGLNKGLFLGTPKDSNATVKQSVNSDRSDFCEYRINQESLLNASDHIDVRGDDKKAKYPGGANFCLGEFMVDDVSMLDYRVAYPLLIERLNVSDETATILPAKVLLNLNGGLTDEQRSQYRTYDYMTHSGICKSSTAILYHQYIYNNLYCGREFPFTDSELRQRGNIPVVIIWHGRRGVLSDIIAEFNIAREDTKNSRKLLEVVLSAIDDRLSEVREEYAAIEALKAESGWSVDETSVTHTHPSVYAHASVGVIGGSGTSDIATGREEARCLGSEVGRSVTRTVLSHDDGSVATIAGFGGGSAGDREGAHERDRVSIAEARSVGKTNIDVVDDDDDGDFGFAQRSEDGDDDDDGDFGIERGDDRSDGDDGDFGLGPGDDRSDDDDGDFGCETDRAEPNGSGGWDASSHDCGDGGGDRDHDGGPNRRHGGSEVSNHGDTADAGNFSRADEGESDGDFGCEQDEKEEGSMRVGTDDSGDDGDFGCFEGDDGGRRDERCGDGSREETRSSDPNNDNDDDDDGDFGCGDDIASAIERDDDDGSGRVGEHGSRAAETDAAERESDRVSGARGKERSIENPSDKLEIGDASNPRTGRSSFKDRADRSDVSDIESGIRKFAGSRLSGHHDSAVGEPDRSNTPITNKRSRSFALNEDTGNDGGINSNKRTSIKLFNFESDAITFYPNKTFDFNDERLSELSCAERIEKLESLRVLVNNERLTYQNSYELQKAIVSSIYGCLGRVAKVIAAITTNGIRCSILEAAQYVANLGFIVYYMDTDSMFIKHPTETRDVSPELNAKFPHTEIERKIYKRCMFVQKKIYYSVSDGELRYSQHVNGPAAWKDFIYFAHHQSHIKTNGDIYKLFVGFFTQVYDRLLSFSEITPEFLDLITKDIKLAAVYKTYTEPSRLKDFLRANYPTIASNFRQSVYYEFDSDVKHAELRPSIHFKSMEQLRSVNLFRFYVHVFKTVFNIIKFHIKRNNDRFILTIDAKPVLLTMISAYLDVYRAKFPQTIIRDVTFTQVDLRDFREYDDLESGDDGEGMVIESVSVAR